MLPLFRAVLHQVFVFAALTCFRLAEKPRMKKISFSIFGGSLACVYVSVARVAAFIFHSRKYVIEL